MSIENREMLNYEVIRKYKETALRMMQYVFPLLMPHELEEAIEYSIVERMKNGKGYIHNNYKNKKVDTTVLEIAEYIMTSEPIITAFGVMFKNHEQVPLNPLTKMVQKFLAGRKLYKKEMFKYTKGSDMYKKYDLLQLLAKIDARIKSIA